MMFFPKNQRKSGATSLNEERETQKNRKRQKRDERRERKTLLEF